VLAPNKQRHFHSLDMYLIGQLSLVLRVKNVLKHVCLGFKCIVYVQNACNSMFY